ncbi:MAG: hypothetical protein HQ463_05985 [Bacteroidetes bacterium]|nr:hypothetical protein [Bacteroidota bacterium]
MLKNKFTNCTIIGYSLGGYVALYLSQKKPLLY